MMIKIVFFAALREQLDCSELSIEVNNVTTVAQVKQALIERRPEWQNILQAGALLMAVNNDMVNAEYPVKGGDEVAFFPPVTGG